MQSQENTFGKCILKVDLAFLNTKGDLSFPLLPHVLISSNCAGGIILQPEIQAQFRCSCGTELLKGKYRLRRAMTYFVIEAPKNVVNQL